MDHFFIIKQKLNWEYWSLKRSNFESSLYLFKDVVTNRKDDIAAQAQYYIGLKLL